VTSDLRDLYQEQILDHSRAPRNRRIPEGANRRAEGYNPLCGDKITVHLRVEGEVVKDVGFEGTGCAISTASASMMTESLKGKTLAEAEALFGRFHDLLTGKPDELQAVWTAFGAKVKRRSRGLVDHSPLTLLIDARGVMRYRYLSGFPDAEIIAADVRNVLKSRASK